jgi:hypothetical protein
VTRNIGSRPNGSCSRFEERARIEDGRVNSDQLL